MESEPKGYEAAFCLVCKVEVFILSAVRASWREHQLQSKGSVLSFQEREVGGWGGGGGRRGREPASRAAGDWQAAPPG